MIIGDKTFSCLLDSGATASVCNSFGADIFSSMGFKKLKGQQISSTLADGSCQKLSDFFSIPVRFESTFSIIKFYIMPNCNNKFLLGNDFCMNAEIVMSYKNKKWHYDTNTEKELENGLNDYSHLNNEEKSKLSKIVAKFNQLCTGKLGRTDKYTHKIDTGDAEPVSKRCYPVSPAVEQRMSQELDRMISLNVIEPADSPWCQPPVLVKKCNGKDRLCIDCRGLNKVTIKSKYALPQIDAILSRLGKAKYITSIDLQDAFWQIPLEESSKEKTAFNVPNRGMWQFKVVPFGLTTAAQAMQKLMDRLFHDDSIFIYLDDIIVVSESFNEHIKALDNVFNKLKSAKLTINIGKCCFCRPSLKYLGFVVDKKGLRTNPEKVECVANYQLPKKVKELRRFLGMASWYRRFVPNFAEIASPLHDLTKHKTRTLKWNEKAKQSFEKLKSELIKAPVLAIPDFSKKFIIQCDASNHAIAAVLVQKDDETDSDRPIAYISRKLRGAELNYSTTEKECLAVVFAIEKFRAYIEGFEFEVLTDHSALLWLFKQQNLTGRLARWVMKLQQFDFDMKHVKGKNNVVPDALSRFPTENLCLIDISSSDLDVKYEKFKRKIENNPIRYKNYKIEDGILYIKLPNQPKSNEIEYKLYVPKSKRIDVMKECHDSPLASHLGAYKTTKRILQRYYWPGVAKEVAQYVKKCHVCLQSKPQTKQEYGKMGKMKKYSRPWQQVSMDLIGPLTRSLKGNSYLFVAYDHFTKYPILVPIRTATAKRCAELVENEVFLRQGIPESIVVDNGSQFTAKHTKNVLKNYNVKLFYNCGYTPQNNPTERANKTIGSAIRSYVEENHRKWDENINKIAIALRTATNAVTGYTPFYLNHGREFISSGSDYMLFDLNDSQPSDKQDCIEKRVEAFKQLSEVTNDIMIRIKKAYEANKSRYDKTKTHFSFSVGDIVYRRNFALSNASKHFSAKLAPKYLRCTVIEKLSDLAYKLKDDQGHIGVYHIKDIKHT